MIRETITATLKAQGVSQRRCALDCGITRQTLNNFLKGHRSLPFDMIETVLKYLKLEINTDGFSLEWQAKLRFQEWELRTNDKEDFLRSENGDWIFIKLKSK